MTLSSIWLFIYLLAYAAVLFRVLSLDERDPASRAAWILILLFLPGLGIIAYLLLGETWIPRRLRRKAMSVDTQLLGDDFTVAESGYKTIPERYQSTFQICAQIAGDRIAAHNSATLADDSNHAIDLMVKSFNEASESIHVSFYIWLTDNNGLKVIEALKRAARRDVACRIIVDAIGSRALIRSSCWSDMQKAGVKTCISMKVARSLEFFFGARVDLRNHRKIVVVDNRITYCGSQNCADPEFRVKAKYAPWVDIMLRCEGPVVRQNQRLFANDWMVENGEDISSLVREEASEPAPNGFAAIAFGTGPISHQGAMSSVFASLLFSAQSEVVISNPYFVPDPPLLAALTSCARRGVKVSLILPARNDSWVVGLISKAHYPQLLEAGVKLFEYRGGLLHAKTLVVDGKVALYGSANMDRRSLDLNFENNMLLHSPEICGQIRQRQDVWLADSNEVTALFVMNRPLLRRIAKNLATIFSPIM